MTTIYLKSATGGTVVSLRGKKGKTPQVPDFMKANGYTVIDEKEFRRLKARIEKTDHAKL